MERTAVVGLVVGVVGLVAAAVMGVLLVTEDDDGSGYKATKEGFVVEPAARVGPDAFTPSVEVEGEEVCDTARFVEELTSRPDAVREWARVLGIPEDEVEGYVATLEPEVLTEDTMVTNHGLRDGSAYARQSMLVAGTAVLMGSSLGGGPQTALPPTETPPPETEPPDTTAPPETTSPPTTPGGDVPVTRCRCGNPLLAAYAPSGGETPTTTSTTATSIVDPPDGGNILVDPPEDPTEPSSPKPSDDTSGSDDTTDTEDPSGSEGSDGSSGSDGSNGSSDGNLKYSGP